MQIKNASALPETFEYFSDLESGFQLNPDPTGMCKSNGAELYIPAGEGALKVKADIAEILQWAKKIDADLEKVMIRLIDSTSRQGLSFAGLKLDHPILMGILNITPDSFHDGGSFSDIEAAIEHALKLIECGAEIIDIGGESTRPGAKAISEQEEIDRIIPVIEGLIKENTIISVDTRRADVMHVALAAGAKVVNDISALSDVRSLEAVKQAKAFAILMHMQGHPKNMQKSPQYGDAPYEITTYLSKMVNRCEKMGIPRSNLAIDPGIGFGKSDMHNLAILKNLSILHGVGSPVAIGVSRKSFIGRLTNTMSTNDRLPGTIAAIVQAMKHGIQIHRVHDVCEVKQALTIWNQIQNA